MPIRACFRLSAIWRDNFFQRHKPRTNKHLLFYDLLSALQKPGCPLCRLVADASARRLAYLFHEEVNDPPTRFRLRASLGFCARHAQQCAHPGNALGLAILYKDLIERSAEHLQHKRKTLRHAPCPECEEEERDIQRFAKALAIDLMETELQVAYRQGEGLCIPHLELVLRYAPPESRRFLQTIEQERLGALAKELSEFIRKNDYRFHKEPMGAERNSWLRALRKLSGMGRQEDTK